MQDSMSPCNQCICRITKPAWKPFSAGFRFDPIAKGSPEALVVLLNYLGSSASRLIPLAAGWATAVPATAFVALKAVEQVDPLSSVSEMTEKIHRSQIMRKMRAKSLVELVRTADTLKVSSQAT
jgi:regulatory LuxR family protein